MLHFFLRVFLICAIDSTTTEYSTSIGCVSSFREQVIVEEYPDIPHTEIEKEVLEGIDGCNPVDLLDQKSEEFSEQSFQLIETRRG